MHFRHEKQQQQQLNTTNVYIDTSTLTFITFFFVPLKMINSLVQR